MIAALLAFCLALSTSKFWRWDYNADADLFKYRVQSAIQVPTYTPCAGDDGAPTFCVAYNTRSWTIIEEIANEMPPEGSTLCTLYDANSSVSVPLGGILFVNIVSLDEAGNVGQ